MSALVRDGVRLWYAETGAGEPSLVFAHGWCCDHTVFAPQLEHFARAHRVVAVDLRGHGRSDKPVQDYSVAAYADDLVWISEQLELAPVVLVGHSLGAVAALEAAARRPDLVAAAVLLDPAPIVRPPGLDDVARPFIVALHGPGYEAAARQHIEEVLFAPTDDPDVRERVVAAMRDTPQHVMASTMEEIFAWDGPAAAAACSVPVACISAASPVGDVAAFKALCPQLVTGQTVGSGHFVQLLAPEQVNAMVEAFLRTALPSSAGGESMPHVHQSRRNRPL